MRFSEDLRWRIIFLIWDGYSQRKIARLLHLSQSCVSKTKALYERTGVVMAERHRSYAKLMRTEDYVELRRSLFQRPMDLMEEHQAVVNTFRALSGEPPVSVPTIFRSIRMLGFTRKKVTRMAKECLLTNQVKFVATCVSLLTRPAQTTGR